MPRRPPLALLLVALLTGCSQDRPATAPPTPTPSPGAAPAGCPALVARLPHQLPQGLKQGAVLPASTSWGDPPIRLRCGVPAGLDTDDPYAFNTVQWAMHDIGSARRWTTRGLPINVEVVVPDAYSSQAELLGSLAEALLTKR